MNEINQELINLFDQKYTQFIQNCDKLEAMDAWNKEENGEMEAYFANHIFCTVIRMLAVDLELSGEELLTAAKLFSFGTPEQTLDESFWELYDHLSELGDDQWFCNWLQEDVDLLYSVDGTMAIAFRELLAIACQITMESDHEIKNVETSFAKQVLETFA